MKGVSNMNNNKHYSHLTFDERCTIENNLNMNMKLSIISAFVNKDPRSVKYEIEAHKYLKPPKKKNKCGNQSMCTKRRLCNQCDSGLCKYCSYGNCNQLCDSFTEFPVCKRIVRYPGVCNGCDDLSKCYLPKLFYSASKAQSEYQSNVSDSKKGTRISDQELKKLDRIVTDGVSRGLSIEVIIEKNSLDISPSTLYRYIDHNLLTVKNIDLKRKVRYKQRYTSKPKAKPINYSYLDGRKPEDYIRFIQENPTANIWQMDTLEGRKGADEPAVLSLLFTKTNLQLYFKINSISTAEVDRIFRGIKKHLGDDLFSEIFECILTDNGKEFKDPLALETSELTGEILTRVFYCRPRHSEEKGKCEKNHEHFREMIPKGISFMNYTHSDMNFISNMVNNYPRKSLGFNSPFEATCALINKKAFELNRLRYISPDKVCIKRLIK